MYKPNLYNSYIMYGALFTQIAKCYYLKTNNEMYEVNFIYLF